MWERLVRFHFIVSLAVAAGILSPSLTHANSVEFPEFCKNLLQISSTAALVAKHVFDLAGTRGIDLTRNYFDAKELETAAQALLHSEDPAIAYFVENAKVLHRSYDPRAGILALRTKAERQFTLPPGQNPIDARLWAKEFKNRKDFAEAQESWIFHEFDEQQVLEGIFLFNANWKPYAARYASGQKLNVSGFVKLLELFNKQVEALDQLWSLAMEHHDPFEKFVISQAAKEIHEPNLQISLGRIQCGSSEQYEAFVQATARQSQNFMILEFLKRASSKNPLAHDSEEPESSEHHDSSDWWQNGGTPPEFTP